MPHPHLELPWQRIGSDLFELHGKPYIIVIDYFSKFLIFDTVKNKSASAVTDFLKPVFITHGIPQHFIADNVPYNSQEFLHLLLTMALLSPLRVPDTHNPME